MNKYTTTEYISKDVSFKWNKVEVIYLVLQTYSNYFNICLLKSYTFMYRF